MSSNNAACTINELKSGCRYDEQKETWTCLICQDVFRQGEVYPIDGHYYLADKAVHQHLAVHHGDRLSTLLDGNHKDLTLTERQMELMRLFAAGQSDQQIAESLAISPSTVRHQKFMFRERARQARLYLAVFELALPDQTAAPNDWVPLHEHATMVDDRYQTTEHERLSIIKNAFSSMQPLRLKVFSAREKKKIVILKEIAGQFARERKYTEPEVNEILKAIYDDFATIRRYLIEYGFMDRTRDCRQYWRQ